MLAAPRRSTLGALACLTTVLVVAGAPQPVFASTSPKAALSTYLNAVDQGRQPYQKAGPAVDAALSGLHNSPDATWVTAAQKVKASASAAAYLAAAVASLKVPSGMAQANGQLHQAAVLAAQYLKALQGDLATRNVAKVQAAFAGTAKLSTTINGLNASWKAAAIAAAHKAGLAVPSWVTTFGNA